MVGYRSAGSHAVLTMERPQARNAVDPALATGIEQALDRAEGDRRVRVVVLTGAPPVFCAGADLKAVAAGEGERLSTARGGFAGIVRRRRVKPLIAAVEGPALAGGTEIVLACDLVVASRSASFGVPEVKRGLIAGAGALFRLGAKLPPNLAMEMVLTGDPCDAVTAHAHGLVNRLCAPGDALTRAVELAEHIAANAPLAIATARTVMLDSMGMPEEQAWARTAQGNRTVLASEDVREGIAAFAEKRAPVWAGR